MGLRRRFQNLLRGAGRSTSQTRCQHDCCQHHHQHQLAAVTPADQQPQLGRRGPTAVATATVQQHQQNPQASQRQQKLRDRHLSRSCERRGNHYASFSTTSSSASASSSSSAGQQNLWRPAQLNNFVRLEAAEASCYVAELSSSFSASSRTSSSSSAVSTAERVAQVYEEIPEPLYDRVAASTESYEHRGEADCDSDEFCSASRYWLYASLPRQHRGRRGRLAGNQDVGPQQQQQQEQLQYQLQPVHCLPLGLTHVDWRGVKCTSF